MSGILHTLLLACNMYNPAELYPDLDLLNLIEKTTEALAANLQGNSGNLSTAWGSDNDRWLEQPLGMLRNLCAPFASLKTVHPTLNVERKEMLGFCVSRLVQWCHGAPGFLPLAVKMYVRHTVELLATASQRAADVIWARGLLVKVSTISTEPLSLHVLGILSQECQSTRAKANKCAR